MDITEIKQELENLLQSFPHPQSALVPMIHVLLEKEGTVPPAALPILAQGCCVDVTQIEGILQHYPVFQKSVQRGARVCLGLVCQINGAEKVYQQVTSESQCHEEFSAIRQCIGHCYAAPAVQYSDGTICKFKTAEEPAGSFRCE